MTDVINLIPDISFYYIEKFFEDFLYKILEDIKNEGEIEIDMITNVNLVLDKDAIDSFDPHNNGNKKEFDFLIYAKKNGVEKIILIEAKTKLSRHYIESQIEKTEEIIEAEDRKLKIVDEYCLVSFNSDNICDNYKYFITKYANGKFNNEADEAKIKSYNFDVPLVKSEDKLLGCLSQTSYSKLKEMIVERIEKYTTRN